MTPLALLFAATVAVQPTQDGGFRLSLLYGGGDPMAHAEAQMQLASAAKRVCRGRGDAVSAGSLELNEVPKTDPARKRGRLSLSEVWRCVPKAR